MTTDNAAVARRLAPPLAAALVFAVMIALYAGGYLAAYDQILKTWGVLPFDFPFLDTDTVLSAVRCRRAGIDVFAVNPCDALGRVYDYSPLWLLLARLPVTRAWLDPIGLGVDIAFIASLALLPPGRGRADTVRILVGVLSPAAVFAIERGNNDLVLFVLAAIAAAAMGRSAALRLCGYACALLAGLLKYYPMALMAMALRERPARFFGVTIASLTAVSMFLALMGRDLFRALRLIPVGSWFGDMFGASTLPGGLGAITGWPHGVTAALRVVLALAALATGVRLGLRPATGAAIERLTERERDFLLAGGLMVLGCFFTAQNIGYRATHLVLVLPTLTALWRTDASTLWPRATYAAILLLWALCWQMVLSPGIVGNTVFLLGWLVREALWWFEIVVLIALVVALLARSTIGRLLVR